MNGAAEATRVRFEATPVEGGKFGVMDTLAWDLVFTRGPRNERVPLLFETKDQAEGEAARRNG